LAFESFEGLELPSDLDVEGIRALRPDETIPTLEGFPLVHTPHAGTVQDFNWLREKVRAPFGKGDSGAIERSRLRSDAATVKMVEGVALKYQHHLAFVDMIGRAADTRFYHTLAAELAVRGALCRPDVAARILARASEREQDRRVPKTVSFDVPIHSAPYGDAYRGPNHPQTRRTIKNPARQHFPEVSDGSLQYWGALCARAAQETPGGVYAACLAKPLGATLNVSTSSPSKQKKNR
jgi:hypothetical protein